MVVICLRSKHEIGFLGSHSGGTHSSAEFRTGKVMHGWRAAEEMAAFEPVRL